MRGTLRSVRGSPNPGVLAAGGPGRWITWRYTRPRLMGKVEKSPPGCNSVEWCARQREIHPETKDTWCSGGKVRESAYSRAPYPRLSSQRLFPEGGESQCELQRPGGAESAGPVAAGPHS